MHVGVLGNANSWYCYDLERAVCDRGHRFSRLDFPRLNAAVAADGSLQVACDDQELNTLDVLIVRTMPAGSLEQVVFRMDALAQLQSRGVIVVNSAKAIECAVDKYLTTARLSAAGLRVPETVVCEHTDVALAAFDSLGRDVVVKPIFGAEGRGIVRVSDLELARRTFRTLERIQSVLYLQKYMENNGYDIRVLVLDGKIVGGMRRHATDDFRSNIAQKGQAEPYSLSKRERQWAVKAASATGTRLAGVDLLYDLGGDLYVIEVNAVPGWRAFNRVTGCDVAVLLIDRLEQGS